LAIETAGYKASSPEDAAADFAGVCTADKLEEAADAVPTPTVVTLSKCSGDKSGNVRFELN
jgi:hypothetical protein